MAASLGHGFNSSIMTPLLQAAWDNFLTEQLNSLSFSVSFLSILHSTYFFCFFQTSQWCRLRTQALSAQRGERGFTPWCKPQPLIDTSLIVSHKQTQMMVCAPCLGAPPWQGPSPPCCLRGAPSFVAEFPSDLNLYGLLGLAPAWAPVQETRMGLQALLAEDT